MIWIWVTFYPFSLLPLQYEGLLIFISSQKCKTLWIEDEFLKFRSVRGLEHLIDSPRILAFSTHSHIVAHLPLVYPVCVEREYLHTDMVSVFPCNAAYLCSGIQGFIEIFFRSLRLHGCHIAEDGIYVLYLVLDCTDYPDVASSEIQFGREFHIEPYIVRAIISFILYKEDWDEPYSQLRKKNPFYGISDDGTTMNWLFAIGQNIHQSATQVVGGPDDDQYQSEQDALDLIVQSAIDIADKYGLADFEVPELLLSFSQSDEIKYNEDQNSAPINKFHITDADGTQRLEYFRFAAETLYDREGDCDCKSVLAYRLLKTLGMDVKLIDICDKGASTPTHAAIMLKDDTNRYPKCTKYPEYTYCEATSNGWRIGNIPEDFDPLSIGILA